MNYNYKEEIKNDICNYLHDHDMTINDYNEDTLEELYHELWPLPEITGERR